MERAHTINHYCIATQNNPCKTRQMPITRIRALRTRKPQQNNRNFAKQCWTNQSNTNARNASAPQRSTTVSRSKRHTYTTPAINRNTACCNVPGRNSNKSMASGCGAAHILTSERCLPAVAVTFLTKTKDQLEQWFVRDDLGDQLDLICHP